MCAGRSTSAIPEIEVIVSTTLRPFLMVLAFWWWLVVFPWCVGVGDGMCCDVACEVMRLAEKWDAIWCNNLTWGEVMWLVARCDVMSPNLAAVTKKWRSNIPSIAPATMALHHHQFLCRTWSDQWSELMVILRLPQTPQHHQMLRLRRKVTGQHHQMICRASCEEWHCNITKRCTQRKVRCEW